MTFKSGAAKSGAVLSPRATCKSKFVKCRQAKWLLRSVALNRICFPTDFIRKGLRGYLERSRRLSSLKVARFFATNNLQRRAVYCLPPKEAGVSPTKAQAAKLVLALLDEAYEKKTWHGPNLKQSLKGVSVVQAAWRPGPGRHNIWELTLHAAYWKYVARRRIEGSKRGSFALKGSNFFPRPEKGNATEAAWAADRKLLEREHRALELAIRRVFKTPRSKKFLPTLYGVAFHDVYHAGQIRLLRRLIK